MLQGDPNKRCSINIPGLIEKLFQTLFLSPKTTRKLLNLFWKFRGIFSIKMRVKLPSSFKRVVKIRYSNIFSLRSTVSGNHSKTLLRYQKQGPIKHRDLSCHNFKRYLYQSPELSKEKEL